MAFIQQRWGCKELPLFKEYSERLNCIRLITGYWGGAFHNASAITWRPLMILSSADTTRIYRYVCLNSTVSEMTFCFVSNFTSS